jgi:hypothetical protein
MTDPPRAIAGERCRKRRSTVRCHPIHYPTLAKLEPTKTSGGGNRHRTPLQNH